MKAYAYVVGPQDRAWTSLFDMVSNLGFAGVSSYRGLSQVEQQAGETPVCYFLFSAVDDVAQLRALAGAIRFCPVGEIRYSPMVYCAEDASLETIVSCINMGFDDIVVLPQTSSGLESRLARQLHETRVFYQTQSYFGPDRRNRVARRPQNHPNTPGGAFRRLEIMRDPDKGVLLQRDEQFAAPDAVATLQNFQQTG
jgi:hypothetical protein